MSKGLISFGAAAGGTVGSLIPVWLWHADTFGGWSILGALVGGLAGIIVTYQLAKQFID